MHHNQSCTRIARALRVNLCTGTLLLCAAFANANVSLKTQVKIADNALHFNGKDFNISAHGDAVKTYKHYVFMTWYLGGKENRNVMLSRYNTLTGAVSTIKFPHKHTGFRGDPNIGESHNTIGLAISPLNGTIHMVYDLHAYDDNNHGGKFKDDFFRYSYSLKNAADAEDKDFTLDLFVKDTRLSKDLN